MTADEIRSKIAFGNFTSQELNEFAQAIIYARNRLGKETKRSLRVGSKVSFVNRAGSTIQGFVEDIKIKNAIVRNGMLRYRVPCSLLTVEE